MIWSLLFGSAVLALTLIFHPCAFVSLAAAPVAVPGPFPGPPRGVGKAARPRRRRWLKRLLIWGGLVVATIGVALIPYPYQAGGPFRLLPVQRFEVRSEIEGLVEKVEVTEGQWVEAGQPIARLVERVPERNLKATQAQLEEAQAKLRLLRAGAKQEEIDLAEAAVATARTNLQWSQPRAERYEQLFAESLVSRQEYENTNRQRDIDVAELEEAIAQLALVRSDARQEEIEAMEKQVESLQALVDNYKVDLARTTLVSPIAGRVVTPRIEELLGTYLKPGQRDLVAQIEDARTIHAEIEIPEEDVGDIRLESVVKVVPWAYHDRTFFGRVVSIAPIAGRNATDSITTATVGDPRTASQVAMSQSNDRVVRVITEIPNSEGLLKSEMTGYAKIACGNRPVWDVLLRPLIRWIEVEVWYWIP